VPTKSLENSLVVPSCLNEAAPGWIPETWRSCIALSDGGAAYSSRMTEA
jgi:hypothetical protein